MTSSLFRLGTTLRFAEAFVVHNNNQRRRVTTQFFLQSSSSLPTRLDGRLFSTAASSDEKTTTTTSSPTDDDEDDDEMLMKIKVERKKKKNFEMRKDKRRLLLARQKRKRLMVGMAKAVDRGQYAVTYNPGGVNGTMFEAKSGLPSSSSFLVLGIESSCDDTGAAIVRSSDGCILGEALASQTEIHEEFGGVVPGLARDAHEDKIDQVIQQALERAGLSSIDEVDAIGVTVGPGLEICLRVGCNTARELAIKYNKPFVGVHHLEAHILMARLPYQNTEKNKDEDDDDEEDTSTTTTTTVQQPPLATEESTTTNEAEEHHPHFLLFPQDIPLQFPFLALLVSGGHCQLMKCLGIGQYKILGGTIDDSLGEAYDKTARLLGLKVGGGGGPAVEKLALDGDPNAIKLSVPMERRREDLDFSYAGLKTQVRMAAEKMKLEKKEGEQEELSYQDRANIAASFQNVAIKHLEQRLNRAMERLEKEETASIRSLAVVGGVAANKELRSRLEAICKEREWKMFVPPPRLCTDQGAMSAWAAIERLMVGSSDEPEGAEVYARYPFANHDDDDDGDDSDSSGDEEET